MIEQPAETLTTANSADAACRRHPIDEFVAKPLMIPLAMIVLDVLRHHPAQLLTSSCARLQAGAGG